MKFQKIPFDELDILDLDWIEPIKGVGKIDVKVMSKEIALGNWDARRLPAPAQGIAVTYPDDGLLFIYYLRGRGLFGSITKQDLLDAAEVDGLNGVAAHVDNKAMYKLLSNLTFVPIEHMSDGYIRMELRNA